MSFFNPIVYRIEKFLTLYNTIPTFSNLAKEAFLIYVGKSSFSFSHNVSLPSPKQFSSLQSHTFCLLQMLSVWTSLKFWRLVKLTLQQIAKIYSPKMKAFTNEKKNNVIQILKFGIGRVENIMGKGKNAGDQHFLLLSQFFLKRPPSSGLLKLRIVWQRVIMTVSVL